MVTVQQKHQNPFLKINDWLNVSLSFVIANQIHDSFFSKYFSFGTVILINMYLKI